MYTGRLQFAVVANVTFGKENKKKTLQKYNTSNKTSIGRLILKGRRSLCGFFLGAYK